MSIHTHPTNMGKIEVYRGVIFDKPNDSVLLVRRSSTDSYQPGQYEFPGGKVDEGEAAVTTLQREIEEETGLVVTTWMDSVETSELYRAEVLIEKGKYEGMMHVSHFILSRIVSGSLQLSDEHDDFMWASVYETPAFGQISDVSEEAFKRFRIRWALANTQ